MDVRRLSLLRELAERGSITAVADATGRTPSAVSQQLKLLEREAGLPLTERKGRGIILTSAGKALARTAADIATAIERAQAVWDDFAAHPRGEVTLFVFQTAGKMFLPAVLHALADVPGLVVTCTDAAPTGTHDYADVAADFDIVMTDSSGVSEDWRERGLVSVPLLREPLDIALPADHRLANRRSLSPADLVDETWIGVPPGLPFDVILKQIEAVNGVPARVTQRFYDNTIVEAMVAAGHGIAILPRFTTQTGLGLVTKPLTEVRASRVISALMRPDRAERPSVRLVVDALKQQAEEIVAARA